MAKADVIAGVFDPDLDPVWSVGEEIHTDDGRAFRITRVERLRSTVRCSDRPAARNPKTAPACQRGRERLRCQTRPPCWRPFIE